jgi:dihydrofolate synthase / folylpolyglutamate synthase
VKAEAGRLAAALGALQGLYPSTIELSLGRMERLLDRLDSPQDRLPPVIHVAGTNGKGSTCAFLGAMADAAGLDVHVFSSPHLVRFNERVRLAGELISDDHFAECLERTHEALQGDAITHFEATTAAAMIAFSETPADLLVLEVGLGGRFDATNVIDRPAVSVIAPVDYDHKQFLGDDLAGIAFEKAGIIRPGCPVISAIQSGVVADVIAKRANALGAPLTFLSDQDSVAIEPPKILLGAHQKGNAALAAKAMRAWQDRRITDEAIARGARDATWPARMQQLGPGPVTAQGQGAEVWLDGGHNPHAARAIAALLGEMPGRTAMVTAMLASKDPHGFFAAFRHLDPPVFTIPNAEGHEAAAPETLARAARDQGLTATPCTTLEDAIAAAVRSGAERILIGGSLYLAGEILLLNGEVPQ